MNTRKGFTLVEILVVIVILGIVAVIVLPQFFDKELQEYSTVIGYIRSDPCAKIKYSESKEEIYLVKEDSGGHGVFFKLNSEYFLKLKEMLKKGGKFGTWTFESEELVRLSDARNYSVWTGVREPEQYTSVVGYMHSNYCVKIEYSQLDDGKIHLVREDSYKVILPLNSECFLKLKEMLKKGGDLGTWTFELVVTDPPGAPDSLVWHGTRSQEQKEI